MVKVMFFFYFDVIEWFGLYSISTKNLKDISLELFNFNSPLCSVVIELFQSYLPRNPPALSSPVFDVVTTFATDDPIPFKKKQSI